MKPAHYLKNCADKKATDRLTDGWSEERTGGRTDGLICDSYITPKLSYGGRLGRTSELAGSFGPAVELPEFEELFRCVGRGSRASETKWRKQLTKRELKNDFF